MTYAEQESRSMKIAEQTKLMVAAGQYQEAFELYQTDTLAVDGVTLEQFINGTIDTIRRAFENAQAMEAHSKSMGMAG